MGDEMRWEREREVGIFTGVGGESKVALTE
jgi:hypothetical protein